MKVAYFSSKFPYEGCCISNKVYPYGGSVLATYYLAKEIAKKGVDVDVYTTSFDNKCKVEKYKNLNINRYASNFKIGSANISMGQFIRPSNRDTDLIHISFDIFPAPFAGLKYALKIDRPIVVTYHGDWDPNFGGFVRRYSLLFNNKYLINKILGRAKHIISPSSSYPYHSKFLKRYINKISFIPNGVNLGQLKTDLSKEECRTILNLPRDNKIILFLGYLTPYKGPDILLKSFLRISKSFPDAYLVYVGNGEMRKDLEKIADFYKISNKIKFYGYVIEDQKKLFFKAADVFCLPSTMSTECYPLAILESMACGTIVVASAIGGIPDIIKNNITGILVRPGNDKDLADKLINLLYKDTFDLDLNKNAYLQVKDYSWELIAEKTKDLYEKVI